jgi:threonine/homoserine/homoserine lactone efflux protein
MLEGITTGFIFSMTLFPGIVWLAKVAMSGTKSQVFVVGLAFWLSHAFWLIVAVVGLMMMSAQLAFIRFGMHLFATFVLLYMSYKFLRSRRVERIDDAPTLLPPRSLFKSAFNQSLAMPVRLPAAMAILLATGAYINHPPDWSSVPGILGGTMVGVTWLWGQFTFLAVFFVKRVPAHITIRSLNKIRPFCMLLCLCLAGIALFLGL